MSSSDEDLIICSAAFIVMSSEARRKKRKWRWWIKTLLKQHGGLSLLANLSMEDGRGFRNLTRMTASDFELLMTIIGSKVSRQNSNYRKSITVNERLAVTLRFLATEDSYQNLMYFFKISKQSSTIVPEVLWSISWRIAGVHRSKYVQIIFFQTQ
jgi:hypothetical protein